MFEMEIRISRLLLGYARMLMADLPDERMSEQPLSGVNNPAWILGHLAYTADGAVAALGGEHALSAEWNKLFGPGSQPSAARSNYPAKEELLGVMEERFQQAQRLASEASQEQVGRPNPHAGLREMLPTVRDLVAFLLTGHLGVHLGQLSSWRRMIGLPPLF